MSAHDAVQMPLRDPHPTGNRFGLTEALVAAERLLIKARHQPASLLATVGVPVAMVLIFGYIFGSAITVPGGADYREYLIPGLFVFVAANLMSPMVTMAQDRQRGFVDRLRSMPITRAAIPAGQATATAIYGLWSFLFMALCGLAVGWRIHAGALNAVLAFALLLAFLVAMTWVGMYLGLVIGNQETAAQVGILVFPAAMVSNIFVPTSQMVPWLRVVADWNPLSALATAVRELFGNPTGPTNGAWPLEHPVLASLLWIVALLLIFVPLCTARYARADR